MAHLWSGRFAGDPDKDLFEFGASFSFDRRLFEDDVTGSLAWWFWLFLHITAAIVWIVASIGFSYYLQNFADYNATYGSLGAVIGFMIWTWISVIVLLIGAELDSEMEHQTARDSTVGPDKPIGERGAAMADKVAESPAK